MSGCRCALIVSRGLVTLIRGGFVVPAVIAPFQGRGWGYGPVVPGRCPGLAYCGPSGRNTGTSPARRAEIYQPRATPWDNGQPQVLSPERAQDSLLTKPPL